MSTCSREDLDYLVSQLALFKKAVDEYGLVGSAREVQPLATPSDGKKTPDSAKGLFFYLLSRFYIFKEILFRAFQEVVIEV